MRRVTVLLAAVLCAAVALSAGAGLAQEKQRKPRAHRRARAMPAGRFVNLVREKLNLSEAQQKKLHELLQKYNQLVRQTRQELGQVLSPEQRRARAELLRKARKEKKRPSRAEIAKALKLTEEQQKKLQELRKKLTELQKKLREERLALLTPEQQTQLKELLKQQRPRGAKRAARRARRPQAAKKQAAEPN